MSSGAPNKLLAQLENRQASVLPPCLRRRIFLLESMRYLTNLLAFPLQVL